MRGKHWELKGGDGKDFCECANAFFLDSYCIAEARTKRKVMAKGQIALSLGKARTSMIQERTIKPNINHTSMQITMELVAHWTLPIR